MIALVKMSLKLLLRNKGFLFFLIATPVVSVLILGIKMEVTSYSEDFGKRTVLELQDYTERAVYMADTSKCIIKVYDASRSGLSDYVLEQLAGLGIYSVCRADVSNLTEKEVRQAAKKDAFDDRAGMLVYLKKDFDEAVLSGSWEEGIRLYEVLEDERAELFRTDLSELLGRVRQLQKLTGNDTEKLMEMLQDIQKLLPEKELVSIAGKESVQLSHRQMGQQAQMGYAFAIITLGFLFCGVCVAHSVIRERDNKVLTRILMTKTGSGKYFASKFLLALFISILQTLVLAVCLCFIPDLDVGINMLSLLLMILMLGLIFSVLSLLTGVIIGDIMSSNYAVFTIWTISSLLSGLYFPLDNTTKVLKVISYLMPQRWFMEASKLLLAGDKGAYSMILYITAAYLIVFISVGSVGIKMKRYE